MENKFLQWKASMYSRDHVQNNKKSGIRKDIWDYKKLSMQK